MSPLKCLVLLFALLNGSFVQVFGIFPLVIPPQLPPQVIKNDVKTVVNLIQNDVETLNNTLFNLKVDMSSFEETLKHIEATLEVLIAKVEVTEWDLVTLITASNEEATKVLNLESSLHDLEQRVTALEGIGVYDPTESLDVIFDTTNIKLPYDKAVENCTNNGGRLATLDSEDKVLAAYLTNTGNYMWVGLRRNNEDEDLEFYWTETGVKRQDYLHWEDTHPKEDKNCALVVKGEEYLIFKSAGCEEDKKVFCEYDKVNT